MRFSQTVSPELADRDFRRFRARSMVGLESLNGDLSANLRKTRIYLRSKREAVVSGEWLAEHSGNKLRLTIANQSLQTKFDTNIRTFADAPAMRFLQTVSPEMPDRDFRRFWPRFRVKIQSLFAQEGHMPLISHRYFGRKCSNINSLDLVAGEPGFEPKLTEIIFLLR